MEVRRPRHSKRSLAPFSAVPGRPEPVGGSFEQALWTLVGLGADLSLFNPGLVEAEVAQS